MLKLNTSVEFQIVALQAVMADLLEGDTIHHAFNIPFFGRNYSTRPVQQGSNKDIEIAKAVLFFASNDSSAATAQNYIFDGGIVN